MKYFSKINNNQDKKQILSNFAWLTSLQIAGYVFPLITIPYLANVIGVNGFGKIAFASAIIVWIQTVADWGFNYTATRDVAKNRDNWDVVSKIFSDVLWSRIALMIVSLLILTIIIIVIPTFRENYAVIYATFLLIPGHILFPDWFFQAIERMKYITILNIIIKSVFTICVFIFIHKPEDYILQPLFTSLGFVISGICALYIIIFKWKIKLSRPNVGNICSTIHNSTDVFINNLAPNLYNSFSIMLLGLFGGPVANGLLDGGNKFINIVMQFQQLISRVFFPFLSRKIEKHEQYARINILSAVVLCALLIIFAPFIIHQMLSTAFDRSIVVLQIMSVSLIFIALSNTYGTNYLIIVNKEKILRNITLIGSIVGGLLSIPLVYYYSYIGAALSITISRGILGISIYATAKSIQRNNAKQIANNNM